jgi:hypothetical protein
MFGGVHDELALDGSHTVQLVLREQLVTGDHQGVHVGDGATYVGTKYLYHSVCFCDHFNCQYSFT